MGERNNNVSKEGIQELYKRMIIEFDNEGKDSSALKERLRMLQVKYKKKNRLITAEGLLRDVIKDVEDFQDIYGMSTNLYYTIKEFLDD
tara:strand:- start:1334 stop:1600 length:267 start_codon:yes stop_codon:yes gene_type:complete